MRKATEKRKATTMAASSADTAGLFDDLLSKLPATKQQLIGDAVKSVFANEEELKAAVRGRNIEQATSLLQEPPLSLVKFDASMLAGILVAPPSELNYFLFLFFHLEL